MDGDHKVPPLRGGSNSPRNYQLLCRDCNVTKGGGTMAQLRRKLQAKGIAPKATVLKRPAAKKKTPSRRPKRDPIFDW